MNACANTYPLLVCLVLGQMGLRYVSADELQTGRHFYAIRNRSDPNTPILRGRTGSLGYAHDAIILVPNVAYREWILQIPTMDVALDDYHAPSAGQWFYLPEFYLDAVLSPDIDEDGLHDLAEFIVGTDPANPDTDGDGISDGAEVQQGTDPLDGLPAATGIIASSDTAGTAVDVCALNDIAVVADSGAGVTVFNVQGTNPVRIAQVDTPGVAVGVACAGNYVAVADGEAGLAVVDISDPPAAAIVHQIPATGLGGGNVQAVTALGLMAFVGTDAGWVSLVDLPTGAVVERIRLAARIEDLVVDGDTLFAYTNNGLQTVAFAEGMVPMGTAGSPGAVNSSHGRGRLFVGGGQARLVHNRGINVFDVSDPAAPVLVLNGIENPPNFGWKQIALNGSGLLVGAASPNQGFDGPHNIRLYDTRVANAFPTFITEFATPGVARAASIYNGLAYIADSESGLHVINYRAYDSGGINPTIELQTSFPLDSPTAGRAEEGKLLRLTAAVTDDVQVRNVEFWIDGARAVTDGNFPFEYRFLTPRLTAEKATFTVRAKATDTGGNFAWSEEIVVTITPDATPPRVLTIQPNGVIPPGHDTWFVTFSEPMDQASLTMASVFIASAGADNRFGTTDDRQLTEATVTYRDTINSTAIAFPEPLGLGVYRGTVTTGATDAAGNALAAGHTWTFAILNSGADDDEDGDDLTNGEELARGLNPLAADSDGDGWIDSIELADNTDPLDRASRPRHTVIARPPVLIDLPSPDAFGTGGFPVVHAQPPLMLLLPSPEMDGSAGAPVILARPLVLIDLPSPDTFGLAGKQSVYAQPPVMLLLPSPAMDGSEGAPAFLARPPLLIDLPSAEAAGGGAGLFLAQPPIEIRIINE